MRNFRTPDWYGERFLARLLNHAYYFPQDAVLTAQQVSYVWDLWSDIEGWI